MNVPSNPTAASLNRTPLEDALSLAARGWSVFPGRLTDDDPSKKVPIGELVEHGFKDATRNAKRIALWWRVRPDAYIGVAMPINTVGLDVDDVSVFDKLGLDLLDGPGQQTPRGGYHRFYKTDGRLIRQSVKTEFPGADTRVGGRGYVFAWEPDKFPAVADLPFAPEWMYGDQDARNGGSDHSGEDPSLAAEAIASGELHIPIGRRDNTLASLAGSIARAYTEGGNLGGTREALQIIAISGAVEQSDTDPITPQDVRRIAASIVGIEERRAAAEGNRINNATDRERRGGDWIMEAPESIESVWGTGGRSLWAVGEPLVVVAPPGVGKTTLIQQVVLHGIGIRTGTFLGHDVTLPDGLIGYIAADRPPQIQRSMRRMVSESDRELLNARLSVWRGSLPFALDNERIDRAQLAEFATERGWSVVIIDSLKDVCSSLNDDASGIRINNQLQEVVARGIEVCVSHHQRKATDFNKAPRKLDDVYGSRWLTGGAGSVLMLWGEAGDEVIDLTHLKQPAENVGPLKLRHDHQRGVTVVDGLAETRVTTPRERNERKARDMRANGESDRDIASELAVTERSVRRYLAHDPTSGQAPDSGWTENGTGPDTGPADNPPVPRRGVVTPSVLSAESDIPPATTEGGFDK